MALFFITMFLFFPVMMFSIFLYLRFSFILLEKLEQQTPSIWQSLGCPQKIFVKSQQGGMYTIKPLFPWLGWLIKGNTDYLPEDLAKQFKKTRYSLIFGFSSFIIVLILFFITLPATN